MSERYDGGLNRTAYPGAVPVLLTVNRRCTIAEVNAGVSILAALPGFKYRMVDARAIAVGGAVAAVTTVDILATLATASRKLVAFAQASLTQSALLRAGAAGAAILTNGASFQTNDVNTPITVGITGAAVTTATHVDISIDYVVEE